MKTIVSILAVIICATFLIGDQCEHRRVLQEIEQTQTATDRAWSILYNRSWSMPTDSLATFIDSLAAIQGLSADEYIDSLIAGKF